jgi:hypothetical protein
MDGRCWYDGEVRVTTTFYFPDEKWPDKLIDDWELYYISGILDLPIVIQDDCQVRLGGWRIYDSESPSYELEIEFLSAEPEPLVKRRMSGQV